MSYIYIPIDFSNVKDIIPPEEEIIYSTLCKIIEIKPALRPSVVGRGPIPGFIMIHRKIKNRIWRSHVIITKKGVAFYEPPNRLIYASRHKIRVRNGFQDMVIYNNIDKNIFYRFKLIREPTYETQEAFIERRSRFYKTLKPFIKELNAEYKKERKTQKLMALHDIQVGRSSFHKDVSHLIRLGPAPRIKEGVTEKKTEDDFWDIAKELREKLKKKE